MTSDLEIEDYFLRKLKETAINPGQNVPLLSKNLRGYVPDGRQTRIANGKYLAGVNQFTEVKVIHNGTVQYNTTDVIDNPEGAVTANKFQGQVGGNYISNPKDKDREHFGTPDDTRDPSRAYSGNSTSSH
jgi:hypothetical protein